MTHFGMIATWRMAYEGVQEGIHLLKAQKDAASALVHAIEMVENYPYYKSVGYGGLPNEEGIVQLDAAFMDGDNFDVGAVAGVEDVKNPISLAYQLSQERFNCFLIGRGARKFAQKELLSMDNMLTDRAKMMWERRVQEIQEHGLSPYDGHDTVGMVALDQHQHMVAGTSSSGLFMKKDGRIGDSALSGSGFYVDSDIGGASATGLGEDIMKGCLSYECVRKMAEGMSPQEAVTLTLKEFIDRLQRKKGKVGAISLVCMNHKGEWGVATNVSFSFVVGTDTLPTTIYVAEPVDHGRAHPEIKVASKEWLAQYQARITQPLT